MDLTPREKQAKELRESEVPPMTWRRVGLAMGLSAAGARANYARAEDKIKAPNQTGLPVATNVSGTEYQDPEKAAEMIDVATNPLLENLAEACRESGLPEQTTRSLLKRLNTKYLQVQGAAERIKTDFLVREFEGLAKDALEAITKDKLDSTSAYQLSLIAAIATDKRELLDGRPTERLSVEDRRSLPEIVSLLMAEAERRGLAPVINPDAGTSTLDYREDAPYQVRAGRERIATIDVEPG